ncbi:hypothetical protein AB1N83_013903, partial [Pleurotus pulmonarius]
MINTSAFLDASNWLVLVNAISFYLSSTPPNRPLAEGGQIIKSTYEKTIIVHALAHKIFICLVNALHILSAFAGGQLGLCAARSSSTPTIPSTTMVIATCASLIMS